MGAIGAASDPGSGSATIRLLQQALRTRKAPREDWRIAIQELREAARERGVWCPHMPSEVGGMGLGITAVAAVSAEAVKYPLGPYIINWRRC